MKLFGVLGGLTPEANAIFARLLHEEVRHRFPGRNHSARFVTAMLDRHELAACCAGRASPPLRRQLQSIARGLATAGVEALVFDSSALHVLADQFGAVPRLPLLSGIEACVAECQVQNITCAGLLGTRGAAEEKLWRDRLMNIAGIHAVLPCQPDRHLVTRIIDDELAHGIVHEASQVAVIRVMKAMGRQRVQGVVVVAPELSLLVHPEDSPLRAFDFAQIHSRAVVGWALSAAKGPG